MEVKTGGGAYDDMLSNMIDRKGRSMCHKKCNVCSLKHLSCWQEYHKEKG